MASAVSEVCALRVCITVVSHLEDTQVLQRDVNLRTGSPSPPHSSAAFSKMESYCLEERTESKQSILLLHRLQVNHFSVIRQKLHMTNNL